jgi:hypothetical protein
MWHAWERSENNARFWWESPKEKDLLEDRGLDGRMGSEWILGMLSGFSWLSIGDSGGLL